MVVPAYEEDADPPARVSGPPPSPSRLDAVLTVIARHVPRRSIASVPSFSTCGAGPKRPRVMKRPTLRMERKMAKVLVLYYSAYGHIEANGPTPWRRVRAKPTRTSMWGTRFGPNLLADGELPRPRRRPVGCEGALHGEGRRCVHVLRAPNMVAKRRRSSRSSRTSFTSEWSLSASTMATLGSRRPRKSPEAPPYGATHDRRRRWFAAAQRRTSCRALAIRDGESPRPPTNCTGNTSS